MERESAEKRPEKQFERMQKRKKKLQKKKDLNLKFCLKSRTTFQHNSEGRSQTNCWKMDLNGAFGNCTVQACWLAWEKFQLNDLNNRKKEKRERKEP